METEKGGHEVEMPPASLLLGEQILSHYPPPFFTHQTFLSTPWLKLGSPGHS